MGGFIAACTQWISPALCPHEGEALGLLLAANWISQMGYSFVVFETDCKMLVDNIHKKGASFSVFGSIVL